MNGIEQLLTQNIAALLMAAGFLWYLARKDNLNKETFEGYQKIINNHFIASTKAQTKLAKNLQQLTSAIKFLNHNVRK